MIFVIEKIVMNILISDDFFFVTRCSLYVVIKRFNTPLKVKSFFIKVGGVRNKFF